MSNEKYVAPEMDVIEFGNEDVCTNSMGWEVTGPGGGVIGGGGITTEKPGELPDEITG